MGFQFANRKPEIIGDDEPNSISSVVNVADVPGQITDINVTVNVDHTFTSDLEISLTAPDGKRVILVSGEGGKQDNFILTRFDDEAFQPITAAAAPFTGTFQPEESLDVFKDLDPNGAWTLAITDSAFEDGGVLKNWLLDIETSDADSDALFFENINPLTIEPGDINTVVSAIHVTGNAGRVLRNISLRLDIEHTYDRDLTITLISPANKRVKLVERRGGSENNFESTVFSDDADISITDGEAPFNGTYRPEESLASLKGDKVTGAWLLEVVDSAWGDGGTLNSWSIQLWTQAATETPVDQPVSNFNITVEFLGGLTSTQQAVFQDAAVRWSEIITGELPPVVIDDVTVEGIHIGARGESIDAVGGVLGQARPTHLRPDSYLPAMGIMAFDTHDLDDMENDGSLLDVIIHEMGHVIGIGTIWQLQGLLQGAGSEQPVFTGGRAQQEYASLLGSAVGEDVPVEGRQAGPGTADGHWKELTFGPELMTGYINSGMKNSISRVTVAALEDMGYQVNMDAADDYSLPTPMLREAIAVAPRGRRCTYLHNEAPVVRGIPLHLTESKVMFTDKIYWDLNLTTSTGLTIGDSGNAGIEAHTSSPFALDPNTNIDLNLQLADTDDLVVLAVTCSIYDETVEVKGDGVTIKLSGPLLLFGDMIKHFSSDLSTLSIKNNHATEKANLKLLIGRKLV